MKRKYRLVALIVTALFFLLLASCAQQTAEKKPAVSSDAAGSATEKPVESKVENESDSETVVQRKNLDADKKDEALSDEEKEFDEFESEFKKAKQKVSDPLEGYNRAMTTFNDKLFIWVINPIAGGYRTILPEAPRQGVKNFLHNLLFPLRFVNNLLQFKIVNAGEETLRFVTNTTIGVLGLWDPAKEWFDLQPHEEDFGQTLGFYGLGAGPHIVLPFFGPSNLRDTFSMVPDNFLDATGQRKPIGQTESYEAEYGILAFKTINRVSLRPGEYESLKKDALDFYPFLRDSYEQMRNKQIKE